MIAGPLLVNAVVVASVTAALALVPRAVGHGLPQLPRPKRRFGPEAGLAVVVALIYLNQLLFTVYIARVHGGDTSFIARYLPPGWFATADRIPALHRLAEHFPAPGLLAPSLLRVQAFLELPFVLLAFATVLRWLDTGLYRRLARPPVIWLAAAAGGGRPALIRALAVFLLAAITISALTDAVLTRTRTERQPS